MTRQSSQQASIINLDAWRKRQSGRPQTRLHADLAALASDQPCGLMPGTSGLATLALHVRADGHSSEAAPPAIACPVFQPRQVSSRSTVLEANLERLLAELDSELVELNQRLNLVLDLSDVVAMD